MTAEAKAVQKALGILKKELSTEDYVNFLRAITPRFRKDSTELLRELTKDLPKEEVFRGVRKIEKARHKP